ncbi:Ig-like domain-containing protein, partial [Bacillus sp. FJAT-29814]|uniref:Ig-like domain-containing protein n=1 Tax=Bacillus sp. FJAT-29814 TaxID=1729688 RepID=UPI0015605898
QYGISRPDVQNAYPAYQNSNSGYQFSLSTKNLTNGQHRLTVRATGNNGSKNELSTLFNVQGLPVIGSIDAPAHGTAVKGDVTVRGWFLDGSGVSKVEVLVDGKRVGDAQYGLPRLDVQNTFPAYQNPNSGYQYTLDSRDLSNGQHVVTIREIGNSGARNDLQTVINVQNLSAVGSIDAPAHGSTIKGDVTVRGWFLDDRGVKKIEVLVDGKSMGEAQYGISRIDVQNAFPEYKNANSGYQFALNTKNLTNGQHRLTIRETANNGSINVIENVVNVQNPPVRGMIDTPAHGSTIKGEVTVRGWLLDDSGVSKIEILVDGKSMGEAQYGISRLDVQNAYPEYKNANSGYQYTLNARNLTNGQHKLTVRETGANGAVNDIDTIVNVQSLP